MALHPPCRITGAHDWAEGSLSMWCVRCWLVKPYRELRKKGTPKMLTIPPPRVQSPPDTGPVWQPRSRKSSLKASVRQKIIERDGLTCRYCRRAVVETVDASRQDRATIDHITPRMLGGTNALDNLCVACNECNAHKGARLPGEFQVSPKGLMTRNERAAVVNEAQNRHQRTHLRRDGQPKRAFDRDEAFDAAAFLAERDGHIMDAFHCAECGDWHIRIHPGQARIIAKQARRWFDPALFAELGPRATGQLMGENSGRRSNRLDNITAHCKGAERRAKHKVSS